MQKTIFPDMSLGFGTGRLCSLNGGLSVANSTRLIQFAFEHGVRFVDTAPSYGQGQAELAIGRLPAATRDQLILCSKAGYQYGRKAALINLAKPLIRPALKSLARLRSTAASARDQMNGAEAFHLTIEPGLISASLDHSLRRLRRAQLDILLLHDPDHRSLDNRFNFDTLKKLVDQGRIRAWGVSTTDAEIARRALELEGLQVLQLPLHAQWLSQHGDVLQQCAQQEVGVIANHVFSRLAAAAAGRGNDASDVAAKVKESLLFAASQDAVKVVLSGTTNREHLLANIGLLHGALVN